MKVNKITLAAVLLALGVLAVAALNMMRSNDHRSEALVGTVLITGSNRGIGLEFARQYAAKGWTVIATHRRDSVPETLQALAEQYDSVTAERMDVLQHAEIDALAEKLSDTPIDILINNAAVMSAGKSSEQAFGTLNHDLFEIYMRTNALGPIKVAESFFPNVAASNLKKIVNISSSSGMVSRPPSKSWPMWYRASKAALNSLMVTMVPAARKSGITVTMFEPGWTWTGKDESNRHWRQLEPADVAAAMIETIEGFTIEDTGKFFKRNGDVQPW